MAEKTGISQNGVQGVLKRWKATGESKCQPRSGRKRKSNMRPTISAESLLRIMVALKRAF